MLNRTIELNTTIVRDEQRLDSRVVVYQARTKTIAQAVVKEVKAYMKHHGFNSNMMEVSEVRRGLKTKNWYVQVVHHNSDIPF